VITVLVHVEFLDEAGVEYRDRDFEIDDERSVVEVGGPDNRQLPVHRDRLHVHHPGLVLVDPHSGPEEFGIPCLACVTNQPGILMGVGNPESHVDSTARSVVQADLEIRIRGEVRRRGVDALTGPTEHQPIGETHLRGRTDGPAIDHRHLRVA